MSFSQAQIKDLLREIKTEQTAQRALLEQIDKKLDKEDKTKK